MRIKSRLQRSPGLVVLLVMTIALAMASAGCSESRSTVSTFTPTAPISLPSDAESNERAIRFLEERVKRDRDDFIAYNKLAEFYLQRLRETGAVSYVNLALEASRASLSAMPPEMNKAGLAVLAQAEFAAHEFVSARNHATRLAELDKGKSYPYQILGDALTELGDYDAAGRVYADMERLGGGASVETRLARAALLHGKRDEAVRHFTTALQIALTSSAPQREATAWIHWQLGEVEFLTGRYAAAEQHYRDALAVFPNYYRALAGVGRSRAALGDIDGAVENYERAVQILPDPSFIAALGDLYRLSGRESEAAKQYQLVEQIQKLNLANGVLYNRQLAMFHADHDLNVKSAYAEAMKEYETRKDVYGSDAVAWTALKAGRIKEAQTAISETLRFGTTDPKLYYHAGMIALANGDRTAARDNLNRALTMSPQFDPIQSANARKALDTLAGEGTGE